MSTDGLPSLEIHTLGSSDLLVDGETASAPLNWKKYRALLTYLAVGPKHTRSRQQLATMFWPNKDSTKARHSLNEALRRIRQVLGQARFTTAQDDESVRLAHENLTVDLIEFRKLSHENPLKAMDLLRGDFLEGFVLGESLEFERWIAQERESIHAQVISVLLNAAHFSISDDHLDLAFSHAKAAHDRALFATKPVELMMQIHALSNRPTKALELYEVFKTNVHHTYHAEKLAILDALAENIASGRWRRGVFHHTDFGPPLLNRNGKCLRAFELTAAAHEKGPLVIIVEGPSGFGRTRLIAECARRFQLQGGVTVMARPLLADVDTRWSTFRGLARAGLSGVPGRAGAEPRKLDVLAAIAPEFSPDGSPKDPKDVKEVADALVELFKAVVEEQPLMIAIDDTKFADGATLSALQDAVTTLATDGSFIPLVIMVASHGDSELDSASLLSFQSAAGRSGVAEVIHLPPLTDEETEQLVGSLSTWHEGEERRARIARRINFETGGNPFLSVTLLRGLEHATSLREDLESWPIPNRTMEGPLPISMPDIARIAIVAQANALLLETRTVLAAASVLGMEINTALLTHVVSDEIEDLDPQLQILERERFLTFNGERFAFAAPVIKEVARRELLVRSKTRVIREKAILWLEGRDDLEAKFLHAELQAEEYPGKETLEAVAKLGLIAIDREAFRRAGRTITIAKRAARKMGEEAGPILEEIEAAIRDAKNEPLTETGK